jgi:predicted small metal-binding protein
LPLHEAKPKMGMMRPFQTYLSEKSMSASKKKARNDEELAQEVLTHAREKHDASDLTEERAREMVASHAEGTEDAS